MKRERKRVVVPVTSILGTALFAGMVMTTFLARRPDVGPPVLMKLFLGVIGPFIVMLSGGACSLLVGLGVIVLLVTPVVIGIVKCRMLPALLGAIPLALLWVAAVFMVCILSGLS